MTQFRMTNGDIVFNIKLVQADLETIHKSIEKSMNIK